MRVYSVKSMNLAWIDRTKLPLNKVNCYFCKVQGLVFIIYEPNFVLVINEILMVLKIKNIYGWIWKYFSLFIVKRFIYLDGDFNSWSDKNSNDPVNMFYLYSPNRFIDFILKNIVIKLANENVKYLKICFANTDQK